jgi:hypothetical protein
MKPKVFIGSSKEALSAAEAVQRELSHECEPVLWSQGIFRNINTPMEDLINAVSQFDFAVFIFLPEDSVQIRGEKELAVRDNVLFELGLFLGKLGRARNFFITPRGEGKLHLPSDLSGITPAEYDAAASNFQAAVGTALYQLKEAVRKLGALTRQEVVVYDSRSDFKPYHFEHRNASIWKDDKPVSPKGEGNLAILPESVLKISRTNTVGRNEIVLLRSGPDQPSISKKQHISYRVLRVRCSARVEGGEHTLRFVAKDLATNRFADTKTTRITSTEWTDVDAYLRVPSTSDLWFRIDDEDVSAAPSAIFIRDLKLTEE